MQQPDWFLSFLKIMRRTGLVNESIYKFVLYYVNEPDMRKKVYMIWTTMRDFRPAITAIVGFIKNERIPVSMVFGKFDRLCPYKWGQQFAGSLDGLAELEMLDTGHLLLHEKHAPKVAAFFCHTFTQTNLRTS
jgi:pimeloyl-ACP methyl ester carboxylesterase